MSRQVFAVSICLLLCAAGGGDAGVGAVRARLSDLNWITGTWRGKLGVSVIEESWAPALGNTMTGVFRAVGGGKVEFYELMAIEETPDGPVLRIRHFGPGLVAWEEKDGALSFHLVECRKGRAIFDNRSRTLPEKLTYTSTGQRGLVVRLEKERNGKPVATEFRFQRE